KEREPVVEEASLPVKDMPVAEASAESVDAGYVEPAAQVSAPGGSVAEPVDGAGPAVTETVEALLFSCEIPLAPRRLADLCGAERKDVLRAIDELNLAYAESGRVFRIVALAGGFRMVTVSGFSELLTRLHKEKIPSRLSRAALETLSIVVFKQPATRAEIDAIRGVTSTDSVLRHLLERKLVRIAGRADAPGRPLLYTTTREFLVYFGLENVSDLPGTAELESLLAGELPEGTLTENGAASEEPDAFDEIPPGDMSEDPETASTAGQESSSHSGRESGTVDDSGAQA
ncbi:MAG: SMC-Scp complex subunit ScpB, partial [Gemmatimonadetes bacterium]|nr:SMC-Scp complex subunit ScpB [Gemmatimonadota bacterium]